MHFGATTKTRGFRKEVPRVLGHATFSVFKTSLLRPGFKPGFFIATSVIPSHSSVVYAKQCVLWSGYQIVRELTLASRTEYGFAV